MAQILKAAWLTKTPIAHRGLHNSELPENSLGAFENAIAHGYAIELDVHRTRDGSIIVFHDDNTKRVTGVDAETWQVEQKNLRNYKLLNTSYTIPLFSQVLALVRGQAPLLIEIKSGPFSGKFEKELCKMLRDYKGDFALQSFSPFALERVRRHGLDFLRGQLASDFKNDPAVPAYEKFVSKNFLLNFLAAPDFIAYDLNAFPSKKVAAMRTEGKPVLGWTVRREDDLAKAHYYCDNIIFEAMQPGFKEFR